MLLLDEPAAGLGEHETAELARLVRQLADDWGMAVLLVEHDVSMVLGVCDRVSVLDFGRVIARRRPRLRSHETAPSSRPTSATRRLQRPLASRSRARRARRCSPRGGSPPGYNDQPAVRDVDLEVRPGEVLLVLGANGAGKSTTLLALAGELKPLAGEVQWHGERIDQPLHRRAARGTALVPEERSAVRSLSVADNLRLGGVRGRRRSARSSPSSSRCSAAAPA